MHREKRQHRGRRQWWADRRNRIYPRFGFGSFGGAEWCQWSRAERYPIVYVSGRRGALLYRSEGEQLTM